MDVSKWQGTIDWDRVRAAGIKYAYIRASNGRSIIDEYFDRNWAEAKRVGVLRGAYQYFRPGEDAAAQASLMLGQMGALQDSDLPPMIDVETTDGQSAGTMVAKMRTWIDAVEAGSGRRPIIYTGVYFWQDNVGSSGAFLDYPLMVPNYGVSCPLIVEPWPRWEIWQYTDSGSVSGISGAVDRDKFNGDYDALLAFVEGSKTCGDGTCSASEGPDTCPTDCSCPALPPGGGVIEDNGGCFTPYGQSDTWHIEQTGSGGRLRWTIAWSQPEENAGTWTIDLAEAGRYRLEVYTPAPYNQSQQARYQIHHAGTDEDVVINQAAASGWQSLGELDFARGGDQWVHLGDSTGEASSLNRKIVFDAIRLTRVEVDPGVDAGPGGGQDAGPGVGPDAGPDDPSDPGDPPGSPGMCAIAAGSPGAASMTTGVLLAAAVLLRRRRGRRSPPRA